MQLPLLESTIPFLEKVWQEISQAQTVIPVSVNRPS